MKPLLATPRPLCVWSRRIMVECMSWFAWCDVCDRQVFPYEPLGRTVAKGTVLTVHGSFFLTPGAAGDEARTHLVQKHPEHPLVL